MTPAQALEMVFGDFAPNTRRAYARVFRDFQAWLDIRELRDLPFRAGFHGLHRG